MRRILPVVLITLGVFAVALAFVVRFYVYPSAAVIPYEMGDEETGEKGQVSTATGSVTVLDKSLIGTKGRDAVRQNVHVTARRVVTTDLSAPETQEGGDVTVWSIGQVVIDDTAAPGKPPITEPKVQSLCLDRSTAEAASPCSKSYVLTCDKDAEVDPCDQVQSGEVRSQAQPGIQYKFPFGTEQKTYKYFDNTVMQATDAEFAGEETLDGLPVYKFVQDIPETLTQELVDPEDQVPGVLFDPELERNVEAKRYYSATNTYWVEPESGQIVKGDSTQKQVLRGPEGTEELVVFEGTLTMVNDDIQANVADAKENRALLRMVRLWVPMGGWIIGGLLIVAGLALELNYRRRASGGEFGRHSA